VGVEVQLIATASALLGLQAAGGMVAELFKQQLPDQNLGDMARQTSKEGVPRHIIFGVVRPIGGNVVAVQDPPRIERRKVKSGGKGGGGKSSQTVEAPRRTYAIAVCEGPITDFRRVWRNQKLVYDGRGTEWGARNNGTFLNRFRFYYGTYTQMPDSNLEAIFGVGNVPAMRGTAYMVAKDEDLNDMGGAVPVWTFEVVRAHGYALTSNTYPLESIDSAEDTGTWDVQQYPEGNIDESAEDTGGTVDSGYFTDAGFEVIIVDPEEVEDGALAVSAGEFREVVPVIYDDGDPEEVETTSGSVVSGVLKLSLIRYTDAEHEELETTSGTVSAGVLNAP
jgi:hypothetical protein